jgi:hypothetical protein
MNDDNNLFNLNNQLNITKEQNAECISKISEKLSLQSSDSPISYSSCEIVDIPKDFN